MFGPVSPARARFTAAVFSGAALAGVIGAYGCEKTYSSGPPDGVGEVMQREVYWSPDGTSTSIPASGGPGAAPKVLPAFPGAVGFAGGITGGRGGAVYKVTNLKTSGPGSLQAALDAAEPRMIVFDVSGVIEGDVVINQGNVTIAGQSAPGAGITIKGRLIAAYRAGVDNIIVRHVRVHPVYDGSVPGDQFDALQMSKSRQILLDHLTVTGGVDETIDLWEASVITVMNSAIVFSAIKGHYEGMHNYGLINGPDGGQITVYRNYWAHHDNRCPALASGPAEVINNVAYDVHHAFVHHNPAKGPFVITGNFYKDGPAAKLHPLWFDDENGYESDTLGYFVEDNFYDNPGGCSGVINDPWNQCDQPLMAPRSMRMEIKPEFAGPTYIAPETTASFANVEPLLGHVGALPRDIITKTAIEDMRRGSGKFGPMFPANYLEGLTVKKAPVDADNDGMADAWEAKNGLNPKDKTDHAKPMPSGYTAIETYLNQLADALVESD